MQEVIRQHYHFSNLSQTSQLNNECGKRGKCGMTNWSDLTQDIVSDVVKSLGLTNVIMTHSKSKVSHALRQELNKFKDPDEIESRSTSGRLMQ